MKYLNSKEKVIELLFCIILGLIFLPPIYLLPITSAFVTSHSLVRYITFGLFLFGMYKIFKGTIQTRIKKDLGFLICFYFVSQSISFFAAANTSAFLEDYKNIIFGIVIFIVTVLFFKKTYVKKLMILLVSVGVINILFALTIYFLPNIVFYIIRPILYDRYWQSFAFQFQRQRFFDNIFVEMTIPFAIYLIITLRKKIIAAFTTLYVSLIFFITIISNWRSKVVFAIFALSSSYIFLLKKQKGTQIIILGAIIVIAFLATVISKELVGGNTIDRFSINSENLHSIDSRLNYWSESIDLATSSPLIGVGLGNYYDNLPLAQQLDSNSTSLDLNESFVMIDNPHNIFFTVLAESGLLGFFAFTFLIVYFIWEDIRIVIKKDLVLMTFIISFWTLFLHSLLNPATFFAYQYMFWAFRGIIYSLQYNIKTS